MAEAYRVLTGMDYAGKRAEPGEIVTDLPTKSIPWLKEQGHIELASEPQSPEKEADE
jgi:hypothetical protein